MMADDDDDDLNNDWQDLEITEEVGTPSCPQHHHPAHLPGCSKFGIIANHVNGKGNKANHVRGGQYPRLIRQQDIDSPPSLRYHQVRI